LVSKQEYLGREIMKRIHIHDPDKGGIFTLTTGSMGAAKTSVISSFADYTTCHHPNEKVFWSECYRAPLQVFRLKSKYHFLVKEDVSLQFRDRNNKHSSMDIPYTTFTDFNDLYEKAKRGCVNVPFFGNRLYWMGFIDHLRNVGEWTHVFLEELAEICPSYQDGILWKYIRDWSKETLKDIRKDLINIHANTQVVSNVDHRVLTYVMVNIFLPGARAFKHSRVTQAAIDNLQRDPVHGHAAYVDASGEFGVTRFRDIYRPNKSFHVDVIPYNGGERSMSLIPSFIKQRYEIDKTGT